MAVVAAIGPVTISVAVGDSEAASGVEMHSNSRSRS